MYRVFAKIALCCVLFALPFGTAAQDRPLATAMDEMRDGNWTAAMITARGDGQVGLDLILWHWLRAGHGDARQLIDFVTRNPDWPGMPYLREKSEAAIVEASHDAVRAFFAEQGPQTGTGALSYARALQAAGRAGEAEAEIVLAWRTLALSSDEHAAFLADHGTLLKPHHAARLDMALWKRWSSNARAMLPLISDGERALAEARLALQSEAAGVDSFIDAVPAALQDDAGLARDRFAWRLAKRRKADAVELLLERSTSAESLKEPWAWGNPRRDLTREAMRDGRYQEAYKIASTHFLTEGSDFAELEWLSGYIALRFLKEPKKAVEHFRNQLLAVDTPISLGRAGYWIGRAEEAAGNVQAAQQAYEFGGAYQTSFYGLLAAEKAGMDVDPRLAGNEEFPDWKDAEWLKSSVYQAAVLLLASDELDLGERFLTHLAESLDRTQIGQMGRMLADFDRPHVQVMLGKRAAQVGMEMHASYYALHPLIDRNFPIPTEMVLAIARRESEFDPKVISHAGARGLMQLMPRTAEAVSGWLGKDYELSRLTSDPEYNAELGSAYLAKLAEDFNGNVVMMSAGYNAGPSRPERWMDLYGDPRKGQIDVIDWIETIPFDETRNYVMRVAESLPIYRARLGRDPLPIPFSKELVGSTLLPRAP